MESSDDNTAVIRMKRDFDAFMSRSTSRSQGLKLPFETSSSSSFLDTSKTSSQAVPLRALIGIYL